VAVERRAAREAGESGTAEAVLGLACHSSCVALQRREVWAAQRREVWAFRLLPHSPPRRKPLEAALGCPQEVPHRWRQGLLAACLRAGRPAKLWGFLALTAPARPCHVPCPLRSRPQPRLQLPELVVRFRPGLVLSALDRVRVLLSARCLAAIPLRLRPSPPPLLLALLHGSHSLGSEVACLL